MVLSFITIKTNNKEMVRGLLKISAINWKILFLNNRKSRAVHGAGDYPLSVVRAFVSNYPPLYVKKF